MPGIREYFQKQLGKTFRLNNPVVDTVLLDQTRDYLAFGSNSDLINNIGYETRRRLGSRYNNQQQVLLIFIPVRPDTARIHGLYSSGTALVLYPEYTRRELPINDSLAFGNHVAAHELGHAFGAAHNNDLEGLMFSSGPPYIHTTRLYYPEAYFLPGEKTIMLKSPFVF